MRCNVVNSKYVKYYRLDTDIDAKGKAKTKMVYTGPLYKWDMPQDEYINVRLRILVLTLISCILFVGSLYFYTELSRTWYIILPYAIQFLILIMQGSVVWNFFFAKQPMNMEIKDKTYDRERTSTVISILINIIVVVSSVITMIIKGYTAIGEIIFVGMVVVFCILSLYRFKVDKCIRVTEIENHLTKEWENI